MTGIAQSAKTYLRFQGRVWLTRLGLWNRVERFRMRRRHRAGWSHERDFAFFRHLEGARRLFLDIGANMGQSALSFGANNSSCTILSFEPNSELEQLLTYAGRLLGDRFSFRMHALGAENHALHYYIPVVRGVALNQEATFVREVLDSDEARARIFRATLCRDYRVIQRELTVHKLDDLRLDPGIVKIDVQGAEIDVLAGMTETIARCRPLFMIEGAAVRDFLAALDYQMFVYDQQLHQLVPAQAAAETLNYFFVPQEMTGALKEKRALAA